MSKLSDPPKTPWLPKADESHPPCRALLQQPNAASTKNGARKCSKLQFFWQQQDIEFFLPAITLMLQLQNETWNGSVSEDLTAASGRVPQRAQAPLTTEDRTGSCLCSGLAFSLQSFLWNYKWDIITQVIHLDPADLQKSDVPN